jgi:hypothetical protein
MTWFAFGRRHSRILFVQTYRHRDETGRAAASDALGFGVTCADALAAGLRAADVRVDVVGSDAVRQTVWVGEVLERVERAVTSAAYDAVLAFHAFWPFAADLRRVLDDSVPRPLVTYTHGSHWDETDLFRFERYPDLRWADLGNLLTRHFPMGSPSAARVRELAGVFPGRVVQGDDLPTDDYYKALWRSRMQVSTAVHESLGVATLEAMVTGNHCPLPRIGAYPEVAADDPAVLYDDLGDLLARLVAGPEAEVVARHDARIRARYSPGTVATAVRDVLAEVIDP